MSFDPIDSSIDDGAWAADEILADPWEWAHRVDETSDVDLSDADVTAVLVTRNAAGWLHRTLHALQNLDSRPQRIIAIDNVSDDDSHDLLVQARDKGIVDAVYKGDADWGFGKAISSAIALDAVVEPAPRDDQAWLWLLHDDAAPASDALSRQLERGIADDDVAVVVPLLLQGTRRGANRLISELGSTITATGVRELVLEQGEIDQGQHESAAVLGGSSCGMLVRRTVWDELAGFDEATPLFRDGLEFGWRANLAGYRVVTAPRAEFTHRQASRAQMRPGMDHPTAQDQATGMILAAAHLQGIKAAVAPVWIALAGVLRSLGFLLGKAPSRAWDELRAVGIYLRGWGRIHRLRRRIRQLDSSDESRTRVRGLLPPRYAWFSRMGAAAAAAAGDRWLEAFGSGDHTTSIDDLTGDDFAGSSGRTVHHRPWLLPTTIMFSVLFLAALVAARHLFGSGHVTSSHLMPAPDALSELYRSYTAGIPGAPSEVAPPWVGLFALASTLFAGQPEWFLTTLVVFSVPLSALAGYGFLRRLCSDRRARIVGSVLYGILPALLGAVSRGQLGILVWAMVVPLLGMSVLAWRRRGTSGQESWRGAFSVALALTILASFTPLVWVFAAGIGLVAVARSLRGAHIVRILVALTVPLLLLSPWIPTLVAHPGRIFTGEDPVLDGMATTNGGLLFLGRTTGAGLPPLWLSMVIFGGIWVMALVGIALRASAVRAWIATSIGSLAFAVVLSKLVVVVPPGASGARPAVGLWLMLAFAALIAAAALGFEGVATRLSQRSFGIWQGLSLLALTSAIIIVLMGVVWWVVAGIAAPLQRTTLSGVPSYARQAQVTTYHPRTLVIDMAGPQPTWDMREGDGTRLGDGERGGAFGGQPAPIDAIRSVVADIAGGRSDERIAMTLNRLGVGYLTVRNGTSEHIAAASSVPGLTSSTGDERSRTWRISAQPARAVVAAQGSVVPIDPQGTVIDAGLASRELILAEPKDPRWRAMLDGKELSPVETDDDDFRQRFFVGDAAGTITYELHDHAWWAVLQLLGLIMLVVLAAPSVRSTEARDPALYARRAAREEDAA